MKFIAYYDSPLGKITLAGDGAGLCGLWFEGEKYTTRTLLRQAAQTTNSTRAILRQKQMPPRERVATRETVR